MRVSEWCGAVLCCAFALAGCASLRYTAGESPAAIRAFAEADALLGRGRYEAALRAYGEFVGHYPASTYADDAYLRIAYIYLTRTDSARGWYGWSGADYYVARDTLRSLLRRYPNTAHRVEAEDWITHLDMLIAFTDAPVGARDSVAALLSAQQGSSISLARMEGEKARLQRNLRRAETQRDSLIAANRQLAERNTALDAELRQIREETERMRRMLIDLERRHTDGP